MWWSFLIGIAVGGGLVMLAAHRRAVRLAREVESARAQSAAHVDALVAERDRLHVACETMRSTLHEELRVLEEALAASQHGDAPHGRNGNHRGEQARAQLALVSRGSEALEQFVAGVLFRGEEATRSAEEARRVAAEAADHAARVERAGTLLVELGDQFGTVRDTMAALARAGGEIGTFVQTIDGIASQTNLLALNAAIEAARAGKHGRGFAVVADEVRKLADDSSRAAEQVSHAVEAILNAIDQVAKVIGSTDAGLAGVREVTVDAQRALSGVVEGLGRTVTFVEQVAASVSGESSALDGLLADMGGIHDHANAALTEATRGDAEGVAREELVTRVLATAERVRGATQRIASSAA